MDGRKYFADVGTELLRWAVDYSVRQGCGGRLRLEASPAYTEWYRAIGFAALPIEAVEFEGVQYVPMELAGVGGQLRDQAQEVSNGQKS